MQYKYATLVKMLHSKSALTVICALILLLGGAYTLNQSSTSATTTATIQKDMYIDTIHNNVKAITKDVYSLTQTVPKNDDERYTQHSKIENVLSRVRQQNMEAEQDYKNLGGLHKEVNEKYRSFLHFAANALVEGYDGKVPDLSSMDQAGRGVLA
jgi:peptidoglycan hydrolase CwlO-like protein